ncbi:MAG: arsenite methyltransferase [Bacteroidota bacterium]|nr:arsenite methyltransferase [Bacteroidota bacterium]
MRKNNEVKQFVMDRYNEVAESSCGCCGDNKHYTMFNDSYAAKKGYVPDADLNLGCGIPTDYVNIKQGEHVLDLGSGAGNDCFVARSIVGENGKVTGLDFSEKMLEKARLNNEKMGYTNVSFLKGDIESIPLPDNSVDVVISNCVLNLVPDKTKAFSEIRRVMKPGGRLSVSDIVIRGELPQELRDAVALYAGCISGALKIDEYIQAFKLAGFENPETKKEKHLPISDSLILKNSTEKALADFKEGLVEVLSITLFARK